MECLNIPPNSLFIGHGYLIHAGAGYDARLTDDITVRYHTYLPLDTFGIPDAVHDDFVVKLMRSMYSD